MILLLAVTAGLHRKEIDVLEWPSFRFKDNAIRIEPTQFFHPKSQDSIGEVQMDPQIMSIFLQYHAKAKGNFVIPSGKPPKTVSRGDYNRCESHFDALNAWLRSRGKYPETTAHAPEGVWFTNQQASWDPRGQQSLEACRYQCDQ